MSFGKDDNHLSNVPGFGSGGTFGQQAAVASTRPTRRGSKMPYWRNNFDLSENPAAPDRFRVLRGAYRQQILDADGNLMEDNFPFVILREHFHGSLQKGAICSAGPYYMDREKRQLCEGCTIFWEDYTERKAKKDRGDTSRGPNRISMMDKFAFTIWDYAYYFEMPQVDSNSGQFRMNPRTNQPYVDWVKARNPQDPQFAGRKWKEGDLRPWAIGKTWKDTLVNWNVSIGNSCVSCGGRDTVQSRGWFCGNPQCRQLIFDPNSTTMSAEQQAEVTRRSYQCPHCGQKALPHEEVACVNCAQGKRAAIFDVDLYGFRQRSGSGNQTQLVITGYSNPCVVQVADPEVLKSIKPMDLLKRFAPTPVEQQRTLWKLGSGTPAAAQAPPPPQQQQQPQWAPPPGAPGPAPAAPVYQQQQAPPAPAPPTQPVPQPVEPNDINAQLAALSNSFGEGNGQ